MNRLNRQAISVRLEALVPSEITDVRIHTRKNILAVNVKNRSALDILSTVKVLGTIMFATKYHRRTILHQV